MNPLVIIQHLAFASIEYLDLQKGHKDTFELIVPFVQLLVQFQFDLALQIPDLTRVQQDLVPNE